MTITSCRVYIDKTPTCCRSIQFRLYLGHFDHKPVTVAMRHLTENEVRYGLSFFSSLYFFKMRIRDETSHILYDVAINKNSCIKRLALAGINRRMIQVAIQTSNFSLFYFLIEPHFKLNYVSQHIFYSHGPLV